MPKKSLPEKAAAERFGSNLREFREMRGLTAKDVGEIVGLNTDTILKYERGEREPSILTLIAFCHLFGVSFDRLIVGERQPKGIMAILSGNQLKKFVVVRDDDGEIGFIGPDRRRDTRGKFKGTEKRKKKK